MLNKAAIPSLQKGYEIRAPFYIDDVEDEILKMSFTEYCGTNCCVGVRDKFR